MKKLFLTSLLFIGIFFYSISSLGQNSVGSIIDNTNLALPSSYNFKEYVFAEPNDEGDCLGNINESSVLNKIYFSQTHRLSTDHPFFFLIGHRPALFQLAITGSGISPDVFLNALKKVWCELKPQFSPKALVVYMSRNPFSINFLAFDFHRQ